MKSLWGMQCDFEFPFCGVGRAIKLCGDKELCAALGSRPFHCSAAHAATATPRRFSVASGATLWSFYNLRYVWRTIAFDKSSLFLDSSLALSLHSPHRVMYVRCKLYASTAIPKVGRQAEWWDKWQWKLDWRGIFVASWILVVLLNRGHIIHPLITLESLLVNRLITTWLCLLPLVPGFPEFRSGTSCTASFPLSWGGAGWRQNRLIAFISLLLRPLHSSPERGHFKGNAFNFWWY